MMVLGLWLALWSGCSKEPEPVELPPPPVLVDPTETGGPEACAVPLALEPADVTTGPLARLQLTASGGTGAYQFALVDPAAGSIHPTQGSYLAPSESNAVDTVVLTDLGCVGEARASITIGNPFTVLPERATVLPGTAFTFETLGGSGRAGCEAIALPSGGSLTPDCGYVAGELEQIDRVRVRDEITDETHDVSITVDEDARMDVWGYDRWAVPLGSTFTPRAVGGSNVFDVEVLTGPAASTGPALTASAAGSGRARITDRFAGFAQDVDYDVIDAYVPPTTWWGPRAFQGSVLAPGDLNGDGFPDAVVANLETNGHAFYSGAVFVYAGNATGIERTPAWSSLGTSRFEFLGRSVDVADVNGDGLLDLLAGSDGADVSTSNIGAVRVWYGVANGFFEDEPSVTLRGVYAGDLAGSSVAACDFDNDGFTDVAVGAYAHEERLDGTYPVTTGAVLLYRGSAAGLPDQPSVIRYGRRIDPLTGDWNTVSNTRLGLLGMAAGDMDGDGDCELAVATIDKGIYGSSAPYGWIALYDGRPSAQGTLSPEPVRIYANVADSNGNLARSIAMGDVDRDGLMDVVTGGYATDGGGNSSGGVYVFLADQVDDRAATVPYTLAEADWVAHGSINSNFMGVHVRAQDIDGDGYADVMGAEPRGEQATSTRDAGRVRIWSGAFIAKTPKGHNGSADAAIIDVAGIEAESYFGQAAAPVGDLDNDGRMDLVVLAGRANAYGLATGAVYFAPGSGAVPTQLDMPGEASGHEHGRGMTVFDATGDGIEDLLVGSPDNADAARSGIFYVGSTTAFEGLGSGRLATKGATLDFDVFDSSDRQGWALAGDSDFDGDGTDDLVVIARADERPNSFNANDVVNPDECPGSIGSAGSATVFLGGSTDVGLRPAFVFYGIDGNAQMRTVTSGLDFNGDGIDDVVVGSRDWGAAGGVAVLLGRPADPLGVTVLCNEPLWEGAQNGGRFGEMVAALGDLDGDGCDEFAAGAPTEDTAVSNQGIVRVFWGYGPACRTAAPEVTALGPGIATVFAGESVAGGGDVDGDNVPDIAVGGTEYRVGSDELGGAWVVPGDYVVKLPRQAADVLPSPDITEVHPLVPQDGRYGIPGTTPSGQFGRSVALVADPGRPGKMALAVGIPQGDDGGVDLAGGVHVYRFVPGATGGPGELEPAEAEPVALAVPRPLEPGEPGLEAVPFLVVGGETHVPGGRLGEGIWAETLEGAPVLLVGAPYSSMQGLQIGGGYVVRLD